MAVPTITTDLTQITDASATTGWNALGGGASGIATETDFFIQGGTCISKAVSISGTVKGMIFSASAGVATGTDTHFLAWIYAYNQSGITVLSDGGMRVTIGTALTAYTDYYVEGFPDTYTYGGWHCYPIRYDAQHTGTNGSVPYRLQTGAPGVSPNFFGGQLKVVGTVKAANLGVDVIRYGTGLYLQAGDSSTPASFTTASVINDNSNNRYGIMQAQPGGFLWQGKFAVGQTSASAATACYFTGANHTIIIPDTVHALPTFTQLIVDHTGTTFNLNNITFLALGTNTPGRLTFNANPATSSLQSVTFANFGPTVLKPAVSATNCTWRGTDQVTQSGSLLLNCAFASLTSTTSLLSDSPGNIKSCSFTSDGDNHAIQITATGSFSLYGHHYSGYVAGVGGTGSTTSSNAVIYNTSGGPVTCSIFGGGDTPSVRNSGSSTTLIITGQVTFTLNGMFSGTEVRIYSGSSPATFTELTGTEDVGTGGSIAYTYTYTTPVTATVAIFHNNYLPLYNTYVLGSTDQTIPIQQTTDRQYFNPP